MCDLSTYVDFKTLNLVPLDALLQEFFLLRRRRFSRPGVGHVQNVWPTKSIRLRLGGMDLVGNEPKNRSMWAFATGPTYLETIGW